MRMKNCPLNEVISYAISRSDWSKLMSADMHDRRRVESIERALIASLRQLRKIHELAQSTGNSELRILLDEQVEFEAH